jgi:large subunit ribosomal protein L24
MAVKLKIKKGDKVVVTTGRDKGKSGDVLRCVPVGKPSTRAGCEYG